MTITSSILILFFSLLFSIYIIFFLQVFTELMVDWIILSGKFMANKRSISVCYFLDSLNFNSFVIPTIEESSYDSSSPSFSCSMSNFLHNHHCQFSNHQYWDYFHQYHLHNLPYFKNVEKFYADYLFLDKLQYPLVICFWGWLYFQLVTFLEPNWLVFSSFYSCK